MSEGNLMGSRRSFNPDEFYSRQTVLRELGPEGQQRLRDSSVVIVGLGGLGSISALYLALAGVGHLRIVDQDTVELNNLHRQVLYTMDDLRHPKVEAAAERLRLVNPEVMIEPIPRNVRKSNIDETVKDMDCILDGLDNMHTRYLLNSASKKHNIPYVFGGAIGLEGNLSVFAPPKTPCLECILPNLGNRHLPTCETRGVLGATPGIIGTMQAMETIKLLAGVAGSLKGKLLICDFRDMSFATIDIFKRPNCPVCQGKIEKSTEAAERLAWLCGRNTVNVNPPEPLNITLDDAYETLKRDFKILVKTSFVVVFEYNGSVEASVFNGGRMLIKNVKDEKAALDIYDAITQKLGAHS